MTDVTRSMLGLLYVTCDKACESAFHQAALNSFALFLPTTELWSLKILGLAMEQLVCGLPTLISTQKAMNDGQTKSLYLPCDESPDS